MKAEFSTGRRIVGYLYVKNRRPEGWHTRRQTLSVDVISDAVRIVADGRASYAVAVREQPPTTASNLCRLVKVTFDTHNNPGYGFECLELFRFVGVLDTIIAEHCRRTPKEIQKGCIRSIEF